MNDVETCGYLKRECTRSPVGSHLIQTGFNNEPLTSRSGFCVLITRRARVSFMFPLKTASKGTLTLTMRQHTERKKKQRFLQSFEA